MTAPHEVPVAGPAADFATVLTAQLPLLTTERLTLRGLQLEDFQVWAEIFCGPASANLGGPFTREQAFTEFAAAAGLWLLRGHGTWSIETEGRTVGFVVIGFEPGDREPELGFLLHPTAEGRGYAREAAEAARTHAFDTLQLPSLVSMIDPDNARSIRLAKRLGARRDGMLDSAEVWRHERPVP